MTTERSAIRSAPYGIYVKPVLVQSLLYASTYIEIQLFEKLKETLFRRVQDDSIADDTESQQVALAASMLLLEVAWADHEIETRELHLIRNALQSLYDISAAHVDSVIDEARVEHESSTSIFPLTRTLNEMLTLQERCKLLEHLWRLNSFDGSEFHYEESVILRISELLYLDHSQFIAAKLVAKNIVTPR